jgi:hypothetical protein
VRVPDGAERRHDATGSTAPAAAVRTTLRPGSAAVVPPHALLLLLLLLLMSTTAPKSTAPVESTLAFCNPTLPAFQPDSTAAMITVLAALLAPESGAETKSPKLTCLLPLFPGLPGKPPGKAVYSTHSAPGGSRHRHSHRAD